MAENHTKNGQIVAKKKTFGQQLADTQEEHYKNFQAESGEVVNAFGPRYMDELNSCIENHVHLKTKFYIQIISKHLIYNPNRGITITFFVRLSKPNMEHSQDLWSYDPATGRKVLEWSLPHVLEMKNFLLAPDRYSPKLIQDIKAFLNIK